MRTIVGRRVSRARNFRTRNFRTRNFRARNFRARNFKVFGEVVDALIMAPRRGAAGGWSVDPVAELEVRSRVPMKFFSEFFPGRVDVPFFTDSRPQIGASLGAAMMREG